MVMACLLLLCLWVLALEGLSVVREKEPYARLRKPRVLAVLVVLTIWLAPGQNNAFIYFAF